MAKLKGEGLNDMDDFMDSFGQGQLVTDDVKCDLCKHLMFDLDAGVSKLRAEGVPEVCAHAASESRRLARSPWRLYPTAKAWMCIWMFESNHTRRMI